MPMFFSMYQGGITPALSRSAVRCFIERDHGRLSSYVRSDIGATWPGRWQFWQLRCRIGAMSFVKVTSCLSPVALCAEGDCAFTECGVTTPATATLNIAVAMARLHLNFIGISLSPP